MILPFTPSKINTQQLVGKFLKAHSWTVSGHPGGTSYLLCVLVHAHGAGRPLVTLDIVDDRGGMSTLRLEAHEVEALLRGETLDFEDGLPDISLL